MNCPGQLRNGPCGGVRLNGKCEVKPEMDCVWVKGYERSSKPHTPTNSTGSTRRSTGAWMAGFLGDICHAGDQIKTGAGNGIRYANEAVRTGRKPAPSCAGGRRNERCYPDPFLPRRPSNRLDLSQR